MRGTAMYFMIMLLGVAAALPMEATARDQIRAVGSATVYPFSASVAEHFGKTGEFLSPVVEATGTGAGFKLFCEGVGSNTVDVVNASRPILASEKEQCEKNGVKNIIEVKFGFDGITLANSNQRPQFNLTKKQIFLALAREVPRNNAWISNPYKKWSEVDASLPDVAIKFYGTPPVSGTRDTFVELVMEKGCKEAAGGALLPKDKNDMKLKCHTIREDGAYIEAGENGNLIAQKLVTDPDSLGMFGFSFLDQNSNKLQGSVINGVAPSFESIQDGSYTISRALYIYVKGEHLPIIKGLSEFVQEYTIETAIGDQGYLAMEGLIPLPEAQRHEVREQAKAALKTQKN